MSIPITIITGYLGAGKTTLVNHVLTHNEGRHIAVIVNDFGDINIDEALIEGQTGEIMSLANGCVCCTVTAGFTKLLSELRSLDPAPEHVLVEASGVADPVRLKDNCRFPGFRVDAIVTLVDAETVKARASDAYIADTVLRQIKAGDFVVVNKRDLMTSDDLANVEKWLKERVPLTPQLTTAKANVPLGILFGIEPVGAKEMAPFTHHPEEDYVAFSFEEEVEFNLTKLERFLRSQCKLLLRAKGFFKLEGEENSRLFQLVGGRWEVSRLEERHPTRLVFIGRRDQLNQSEFLQLFRSAARALKP